MAQGSNRTLSRFDIVEEPRDEVYRALVRWCAARCSTGLLVVRSWDDLAGSAIDLLNELASALTSVETTQQWPGTALLSSNEYATVYRYQLTPPSIDLFTKAVGRLYEWTEPARPDDLCLLRSDGVPMLVSIAHENDAYLNLMVDEPGIIERDLPALKVRRAHLTR